MLPAPATQRCLGSNCQSCLGCLVGMHATPPRRCSHEVQQPPIATLILTTKEACGGRLCRSLLPDFELQA